MWGQVLQRIDSETKNDLGYLDDNMKPSKLVPSLERHLLVYGVVWPIETPYILLWASF